MTDSNTFNEASYLRQTVGIVDHTHNTTSANNLGAGSARDLVTFLQPDSTYLSPEASKLVTASSSSLRISNKPRRVVIS